jgi:hypothetical protein
MAEFMNKKMEHPNLNRKMKKIFRLLKKGHIINCNEGTTEFRFNDNHFELRFLDCSEEWEPLAPEDIQSEIIDVLWGQDYIVDQKDRIYVHFEVKFCWYDFLVGFYWDRKKKTLFFYPFPMIAFCFNFQRLTI